MSSNSGYGGGSSSSGALLQLLATGTLNNVIDKNASKTHFKSTYNKSTPFAMESVTQAFQGSPSFNGESMMQLNRAGDMLYKQYIKIELPGLRVQRREDTMNVNQPSFPSADCDLTACADNSVWLAYCADGYTQRSDAGKEEMLQAARLKWEDANYGCAPPLAEAPCNSLYNVDESVDAAWWTECVAFACLKRVELKIGGSVVDVTWSELLYVMEELCSGHKKLTEMIGRTYRDVNKLIENSRCAQTYWVPLSFFYCQAPSLAFPLCAVQFHNLQLHVQWAPLSSLIHKSSADLIVLDSKHGTPIQDSSLKASVETTMIHLSTEERDTVIANPGSFLITQNQAKLVPVTTSNVDVSLGFNFCVSHIAFCVRRKSSKEANDHFNFSGIGGKAPMHNCSLSFNNTPRVSSKPESWWRLLQPYQHFNSLPLGRIYAYSFALYPCTTTEPSGSVNCSRLDSMNLEMTLQSEFGSGVDGEASLFVFARGYNVLNITSGLCAILYSS